MSGYVCIAMLEDPPYNMYLAATEEEPEDWRRSLPLPSHLLCYEQFKDPEDFVRQYAKALLVCAIKVLDGKAFPAPPHEAIRCFMTVRDKVLREGGIDLTQSATKNRPASVLESDLGEEVPFLLREPQDQADAPILDENPPVIASTTDAENYPEEAIDYDLFEFTAHEDHAVLTRYIGFDDASVVIPCRWNGLPVTVIGERAFAKALELREVHISKSIETIENRAFAECPELSVVNLPDTLKEIGVVCFGGCMSLVDIRLPESLKEIGDYCFTGCASLAEISLPESVNRIGKTAFFSCAALRKVTLPKRLEEIPDSAFGDCSSLESVDFPTQLKIVGPDAFGWCTALRTVEFKEGLVALGKAAFNGCSSLVEAHIPSSVNQLETGESGRLDIFGDCPNVTVFCKPGSAIHMYCREHGIKCAKAR